MIAVYGFALLVGGGLFLLSLFGADDMGDHGAGVAHDLGHNPIQWLSLRSVMYFLFVFGGVGAALTWTWPTGTAPFIGGIATAAGLGMGALVTAAFRYLRDTETGYRTGDETFVGLQARVTLPFGESGTGKVLVVRGDRTFELLARPYDANDERPKLGDEVVVVDIRQGVARVASLGSAANLLSSPDPS